MKFQWYVLSILTVLFLSACDSDGNNNRSGPAPIELAALQVFHGSPDAPAVNIKINGAVALEGVDYLSSSEFINLEAGTYDVAVEAILPGGNVDVIGPVALSFAGGQVYTVAALNSCGDAACSGIEAFVSSGTAEAPVGSGSVRLFVIHGVPGVPVDVYITAPGGDLVDPITFDYQEEIGPVEVPEGNYQIRVTLAGDVGSPLFDSGALELGGGTDLRLVAVPNVDGGPAALTLAGLSNAGPIVVRDVNTPTALRVGHLSPDTGAVDVVVDGATFLDDVIFPMVTPLGALPAATYNVQVTDGSNPGVVAIGPVDLNLAAGTAYTVLAVDFFNSITPLIETDDPRSVATHAKVRIIHASPTAQDVDIYVTGEATDINDVDPTLTSVPFAANTGYIALPAGTYKASVAPAGTKTVAIEAVFTVENGGVYTAIARDPATADVFVPGSETGFGLVVVTDEIVEGP